MDPRVRGPDGIQAQINSHSTGFTPASSVTTTDTFSSPLSLACRVARCSGVSTATARNAPVARLRKAIFSSFASGTQSSRTFMPTTMPVAVSASRFMAEACTPCRWFCTGRSLAIATSTRCGDISTKSSPAVPVNGTARRNTRLRTQGRRKPGTSDSRSSWRCMRLG